MTKKNVLTTTLLLFTAVILLFTSVASADTVDSLRSLLPAVKSDSAKVDLLNNIFNELLKGSEVPLPEAVAEYQIQALNLAQSNHYRKGEAMTYYLMGKNEMISHNHLDKATQFFLKSLVIYESIRDTEGISSCNLQFGVISYELQNYNEAIAYLRKSIKYSDGKASLRAVAHYLTALAYSELNEIPKAIAMFDTSLAEYREIDNDVGVLNCNSFIGKMYSNAGDYGKAIQHLNEIIENPKYKSDAERLVPAYAFLSTAYLKNKDYDNAIYYGSLAIRLSGNIPGAMLYLKEAESTLAVAYEKNGNTTQALFYLNKLNELKDSIYNSNILQRISEMKSKYEFEQEMKVHKIEQEKKEAIATAALKRQKLLRNVFVGGFAIVLLFANIFFYQRNKINKGKKLSDELLRNILPVEVAEELKQKGTADAKQFEEVTVMFTDFKGFTQISEKLSPAELVAEIHKCFMAFDNIITKHNIEKIKTIGDSYMCAGGLPVANKTHAEDVVKAALEIHQFMEAQLKASPLGKFGGARIGIHTGPVVAGIVGLQKFAYDIWGDTVNIASRMESSGEAGKVNISGSTYELVKNKFNCIHRGKIMAKNKGEVDMYFVESNS